MANKKMTEIELELVQATGLFTKDPKTKEIKLKLKKGETRQEWLKRLVTSVHELEKDEWEALSDPSQDWFNNATDAIHNNEDIAEPSDDEGEGDEGEADEEAGEAEGDDGDEGEAEDDPPPRRTRRTASRDNDDGEAEPKAPAKAPKKGKGSDDGDSEKKPRAAAKPAGAQAAVKRAIISDPSASIDAILDQVRKEGHEPTRVAVSTIRSGMMQSLRILKDMGRLKGVSLP